MLTVFSPSDMVAFCLRVLTDHGLRFPVWYELHFFKQGTLNHVNTYADENITLVHPNPVQSDSDYVFPEIYLSRGEYTVCMFDDTGKAVSSRDFEINPIFTDLYGDWAKQLTDKQIEELSK